MNDKKQIVQSKLILASASPRRRDILKQMGLEFSVLAADVDERLTMDIPSLAVEELSRRKALACLEKVKGEESIQKPVLILGEKALQLLQNPNLEKSYFFSSPSQEISGTVN